jgi:hypothetical protein
LQCCVDGPKRIQTGQDSKRAGFKKGRIQTGQDSNRAGFKKGRIQRRQELEAAAESTAAWLVTLFSAQ